MTPETFEEWKVKFEAEMAPMRLAIRQKNQTSAEGRMTGASRCREGCFVCACCSLSLSLSFFLSCACSFYDVGVLE